MKQWPKNGKTVSFRELVKPVREAILFAYRIERVSKNRSIPWTGLNVGDDTLVGDFSPAEKLRRSNLHYSEESQGRDALDEIIGIAIQLGIEQGKRSSREKQSGDIVLIDLSLKTAQSSLARLKKP